MHPLGATLPTLHNRSLYLKIGEAATLHDLKPINLVPFLQRQRAPVLPSLCVIDHRFAGIFGRGEVLGKGSLEEADHYMRFLAITIIINSVI